MIDRPLVLLGAAILTVLVVAGCSDPTDGTGSRPPSSGPTHTGGAPTTPDASVSSPPPLADIDPCTAIDPDDAKQFEVTSTTPSTKGVLGGGACEYRVDADEAYVVTLAPGVAIARFSALTAAQQRTDTSMPYQGRPAFISTVPGSTSSCLVGIAVTASDLLVVDGTDSTAPSTEVMCEDAQVFAGSAVTGWEIASLPH